MLLSIVLTLSSLAVFAQSEKEKEEVDPDNVKVEDVKFSHGIGKNRDSAVIIDLKGEGGQVAPSGRYYLDDVTVTVHLGYEVWVENKVKHRYFSSSMRFTAFEVGGHDKKVAFWLPGAVVKRDRITSEPKYWVVELKLGEEVIKINKDNYRFNASPKLANLIEKQGEKVLESFVRQAIASQPGILKPTYLTTNSESGPIWSSRLHS